MKQSKLILGWLLLIWGSGWTALGVMFILPNAYMLEDNFSILLDFVFVRVGLPGLLPFAIGIFLVRVPAESLRDFFSRLVSRIKGVSSNVTSTRPDTRPAVRIAKAALAFGVLLLLYAMFMDVSVEAGYGHRVVNLDLLSQRQTALTVGGIAILGGLIAMFLGRGSSPTAGHRNQNAEWKKCPQCAEEVRAAAIKCRYCQADLD